MKILAICASGVGTSMIMKKTIAEFPALIKEASSVFLPVTSKLVLLVNNLTAPEFGIFVVSIFNLPFTSTFDALFSSNFSTGFPILIAAEFTPSPITVIFVSPLNIAFDSSPETYTPAK